MRHNAEETDDDAYDEGVRRAGTSKDMNNMTRGDEGPACQAHVECVYDEKTAKPGMRAGAIESLNQRVATLENMFLGQGLLWQQVWRCFDSAGQANSPLTCSLRPSKTLQECTAELRQLLSTLGPEGQGSSADARGPPGTKRRKVDNGEYSTAQAPSSLEFGDLRLPDDLVDSLVDIYFARIQPWIPILHVRRFRQEAKVASERQKLKNVFHAIVSLCARFSDDPRLANPETRSNLAQRCRQSVILESMESFSVENLQALIICAFDTIGSGRGPSTWSIVGSMARTAEHLQLSVEDEDARQPTGGSKSLITRIAFLPPCRDWTEVEGRRRVFWNVFLMDRFCSMATGWNLSLKSAEVRRRLPCEGALWEAGEPLPSPTPYFGVSDQSNQMSGTLPDSRLETDDTAALGGFGYCIEATENLSLVTSFFLQKVVEVTNMHDVQVWLVRFKQLDLRLVQWKIFLPEKWREACALNADGNMDPNLTLAHMTHNTAVVLLHQCIAYPSPDWQASPIRLPSSSSAETCLAAAREVAIIADKFLQDADFLTNPQFAFCLFICGRMLLAHSAYYSTELPREFDVLVNSLWEVSRRWNGPHASLKRPASGDNLASKFASRLTHARQLGPNSILDIRQPAYSENQGQPRTITSPAARRPEAGQAPFNLTDGAVTHPSEGSNSSIRPGGYLDGQPGHFPVPTEQQDSPDSITLAFPPLPMAFKALSAGQSAMHSPTLGADHAAVVQFEPSMDGFETLNSFLDYPFLPDQRVSMFSHTAGTDPTETGGQ
ncbi:hypothetical protein DL766_007236 [Monosporascus sp. MC13-8B]|nr:hypothetical protein DL766_007236 [Monosporascus sp. MC13-8B]